MNGLDSSFEALAFIPVNLSPLLSAVAHNIWAWLAFFTAAFSFWRLYASSLRTTSSHVLFPLRPQRKEAKTVFAASKTTSFEGIEEEEEEERDEEDEVEEQKKRVVVGVGLTRGNSNNKFFTVYYEERESHDDHHHMDDDEKADVDDDDDDDDEIDGGDGAADDNKKNTSRSVVIKRWGSTGSTVEMRRSSSSSSSEYDMGWYSYQDRKVINGSVVRLWEEERENNGCVSPRNCRRPCLVGLTSLA